MNIKRTQIINTITILLLAITTTSYAAVGDFYSPIAIEKKSSGLHIYVAQSTANQIDEISTLTNTVTRTFSLAGPPNGLAVSQDDQKLYITSGDYAGKLTLIDLNTGIPLQSTTTGHTPVAPSVNSSSNKVYVANRFNNTISVFNATTLQLLNTISVNREPIATSLTSNGNTLVVAHHLPQGAANTGTHAANVTLISTATETIIQTLQLPDGASSLKDVCISPDNQYAYVSHVLARYKMPFTQLDRGWLVTNAVSVIRLSDNTYLNTFLLDDIYEGAANPWAIACSADGTQLYVTHAGLHEISIIDLTILHQRLADPTAYAAAGGFANTTADIPHDMGFLSGIRQRLKLNGNGPRSIAVVGNIVYVGEYFTDSISYFDITTTPITPQSLLLGPQNTPTAERRGEKYFNDATACFQHWLSCTTCHSDNSSDGFNWDLSVDGYGSLRATKSPLYSAFTPPMDSNGGRPDLDFIVRENFKGDYRISDYPEQDAADVVTYLTSLTPKPSPHLVSGQLSPNAQNGQTLFANRCASCHSGTYFTDLNKHNVGTGLTVNEMLDTPSLVGLWRTAPYLNDGRAATIQEVLTTHNPTDQHGTTSNLTTQQIDDLAEYVLSIGPVIVTESDPPSPNPMTFATDPMAISNSQVSMTATTASDSNGPIEYYFTETTGLTGSNNSGWQVSTTYIDSGLQSCGSYSYTVKARDVFGNETGESQSISVSLPGADTDFNNDYITDTADLMILLSVWLNQNCDQNNNNCNQADLNCDGAVNFLDYTIFLQDWLVVINCTVPDVVNQTQATAEALITSSNFTVGSVTSTSHVTIPAGQVISQTPPALSQIICGSSVDLVVSTGFPQCQIPNVVNMTQANAQTAITTAGFTVGAITQTHHNTVPAGAVISQNPTDGGIVDCFGTIDFVVSTGPPTCGSTWQAMVNNTDPSISYINFGGNVSAVGGFNNDAQWGVNPGATANFSFTGAGFRIYVWQFDDQQTFTISIDGGTAQSVTVPAGAENGVIAFEISSLSCDDHTVLITHVSGETHLDAYQILN